MSILVAGWDSKDGPSLYQVDPSGTYWPWKATAIGKNTTNAKQFLEKRYCSPVSLKVSHKHTIDPFFAFRYNDDISIEDAIHTSLLTLREGFEGQLTEKTLEIGVIGGSGASIVRNTDDIPVFRKLSEGDVRDYLVSVCLYLCVFYIPSLTFSMSLVFISTGAMIE